MENESIVELRKPLENIEGDYLSNVDRFERIEFNRPSSEYGSTLQQVGKEFSAVAYYGSLGLFDPKNWTIDGPILAKKFGTSYLTGVAMATGVGVVLGAALGMLFDPSDKSAYGLDEQYDYVHIWDEYFDTPGVRTYPGQGDYYR